MKGKAKALLLLPLFILIWSVVGQAKEWALLNQKQDLRGMLSLSQDLKLDSNHEEKVSYEKMDKTVWKAKLKKEDRVVADVSLETAQLYNGDWYYLMRVEGKEKKNSKYPVTLDMGAEWLQIDQISYLDKTVENQQGESSYKWQTKSYSPIEWPEQGYFAGHKGNTQAYLSRTEIYEKGKSETLISQPEFSNVPKILSGKLSFMFHSGEGFITEQWGMISKENLVDTGNPMVAEELSFLEKYKWSSNGMYYPLPESYEPYYEKGYFLNPAQHVGESYLEIAEWGRFFEDFAMVTLYKSVERQNEQGFWWMSTQSKWLYEDYGIPSMYYDTRWCTDAALFLLEGYQKYQEKLFLKSAVKYAEYFKQHASVHNHQVGETGILVEDYAHPQAKKKTHSSLNHHLAEMNFLLELYLETNNKEYLALAEKMKQGVKETARSYIKDTGDLWYAYMPDGSFGMQDYPTLTLDDLQKSKALWLQIESKVDEDLQFLIDKKEEYRKKKIDT